MSYSKGDIVLIPYPFTDLTTSKVRPAVVVSTNNAPYGNIFIVPLTSKTQNLIEGNLHWKNGRKLDLMCQQQ